MRYKIFSILVFLFMLSHGEGRKSNDDDDELDLKLHLGRLYEDDHDEGLDPHDMFNYMDSKRKPSNKIDHNMFDTSHWTEDRDIRDKRDHCSYDMQQLRDEQEKLSLCRDEVEALQMIVQEDQRKLSALEKKVMREDALDMQAFYRRAVYHMWRSLDLEEGLTILQDGNQAIVRQMIVHIDRDHAESIKQYLDNQSHLQLVDEFFRTAFELVTPLTEESWNFSRVWENLISVIDVVKKVEVWLYMLCIGFILLGVWAVYLFIQDIHTHRRWSRVVVFMMVVSVFICFLWQWQHMHRLAESRRHAQMAKRGYKGVPEDCKPGGRGRTATALEWIKINVFGGPDECEKYFEEMMIDPTQEITPVMVISETLAKFFLQPLQTLGKESAKFFKSFYGDLPLAYQVPATVFFVVIMVVILFVVFGYGIDFPFWLGGIRPIYRPESTDTSEVDRITREAIEQLKADREKFMEESRKMLSDISQAAVSAQSQGGFQPLMLLSSDILSSQLETLIAQKLTQVLPSQVTDDMSLLGRSQSPSHSDGAVDNLTSTPLRQIYSSEEKLENDSNAQLMLGREETDGKEGGERSDEHLNNQARKSGPQPIEVYTDAVHPRLRGNSKKPAILPPKKPNSRTSSPALSTRNYDDTRRRCDSPSNTSTVSEYFQNTEGARGCSPSLHEIHPSRSRKDLDESHNESLSNESSSTEFVNQVRSLIESANSSLDSSQLDLDSDRKNSTKKIRGRRTISRGSSRSSSQDDNQEELELSASGAKFLTKVKKTMTL